MTTPKDNTPPVIGETSNNRLNSREVTPEKVKELLDNITSGNWQVDHDEFFKLSKITNEHFTICENVERDDDAFIAAALRKLLESKDCAVRALLFKEPSPQK